MKYPNEVTACVIDHGLFIPLARRLALDFKRVMYYTPWEKGFPSLADCILGDGFHELERVDDIWSHKHDIDVFVFPDIQHSALQLELESQGYPVWGSRTGDQLELDRGLFLDALDEIGLEVPPYKRVEGLGDLRCYLKNRTDQYIKISKYRGDMETWHWRDWKLDEPMLDYLGVRFGSASDLITFYVFQNLETDLEVGYDGYCVNGEFPRIGIQGYECKDKGFLCHAQPYDELPPQVREVNAAFAPLLREHRYRNFFSSEIRIVGEKAYFIDPCCRCPSPSTEAQIELYDNLGEIIWMGAQGELIEPKLSADYAAECGVVAPKRKEGQWHATELDPEVERHVHAGCCCQIEGRLCFPPPDSGVHDVCWLAATGDSPKAAVQTLIKYSTLLPDGWSAETEALADLIKEIDEAEAKGIEFTKMQMPKPSIVFDA